MPIPSIASSGLTRVACGILVLALASCGGPNAAPPVEAAPIVEAPGDEAPGAEAPAPAEPPAAPTVMQVTLGESHGCALMSDATARCWGDHDGAPRETFAVDRIALEGVAQLAAGEAFTCARLADGSVHCWGRFGSSSRQPVAVALPGPAVEIACGQTHACARLESGRVACWGNNSYHALGLPYAQSYPEGTEIPTVHDAVRVVAGKRHGCALGRGGEVWCWGDASSNPVHGREDFTPPELLEGASGAVDVFAGGTRTCVLLEGGLARCWGSFEGSNAAPDVAASIVADVPFTSLALSRTHACGRGADGSVSCWGENADGELGDGTRVTRTSPVHALVEGAENVAVGNGFGCAVRTGGSLSCWGRAEGGRLPAARSARATPLPVPGVEGAIAIRAAAQSTCALLQDGTVSCWGTGVGEGIAHGPARIAGIEGASALAVGGTHVCAVVQGSVRCQGANASGQLGTGNTRAHDDAVAVPSVRDAVEVVATETTSCAVTGGGDVYCWGAAAPSLFAARGSATDRPVRPRPVAGLHGVTAMALDEGNACARVADGHVMCWGLHREAGQTCEPGPTDAPVCTDFVARTPTAVEGVDGVTRMRIVEYAGVFQRADGGAYAIDFSPERIDGGPMSRSHWRVGARASLLSGTEPHVQNGCDLDAGGHAVCAGRNAFGQAGAGHFRRTAAPALVPGLGTARDVTTGGRHACALLEDGTVWCWGDNSRRQLGTAEPDGATPSTLDLAAP